MPDPKGGPFLTAAGYLREGVPLAAWALELYEYPPRPVEIIRNGILDHQGRLTLVGRARIGKTTWLLNLAMHLVCGINFLGLEIPKPVRVLFVNLEVSERRFQERFRRFIRAFRQRHPGADSGDEMRFATPPREQRPKLDDKDGLAWFIRQAREIKPQVLIIDPLRRAHSQDENSSQAMGVVFNAIDQLTDQNDGVAVILSHHTGKPGLEGRRLQGADMARGTSDFEGWPDSLLWLEKKNGVIELGSSLRNGPEVTLHFTIGPDFVIEPAGRPLAGSEKKTKSQEAQAAIEEALADGEWCRQPDLQEHIVEECRLCSPTLFKMTISAMRDGGLIVVRQQKEGNRTVHLLSLAPSMEAEPD